MGAEPEGAPLGPKAPVWVDRWPRGRVAKRSPNFLRENVKTHQTKRTTTLFPWQISGSLKVA